MTKFYNPSPVQQNPVAKANEAKSLITTFVTIANVGLLNAGLTGIQEQQKIRANLDKQLRGIYKQAVEERKRREATQLPTHAKHEVRQASVDSRRSNCR